MESKFLKLFIIHFIIIYLIICYLPNIRITLSADPFTYFIKNITFEFLSKGIISALLSIILSLIYLKLSSKKS